MDRAVSRVAFAVLTVTTLVASACSLLTLLTPDPEEATLQFVIDDHQGELLTWDGELVQLHQSLEDSVGLAGLEIEVSGIGPAGTYTYTAADFRRGFEPPSMLTEEIDVPVSGEVRVVVRVRQDDEVVVEGAVSWDLAPNIAWWMLISRAQYPPNDPGIGIVYDAENIGCLDHLGCWRRWRFPIRADAANYQSEALWLRVSRPEILWCLRDGTCVI